MTFRECSNAFGSPCPSGAGLDCSGCEFLQGDDEPMTPREIEARRDLRHALELLERSVVAATLLRRALVEMIYRFAPTNEGLTDAQRATAARAREALR